MNTQAIGVAKSLVALILRTCWRAFCQLPAMWGLGCLLVGVLSISTVWGQVAELPVFQTAAPPAVTLVKQTLPTATAEPFLGSGPAVPSQAVRAADRISWAATPHFEFAQDSRSKGLDGAGLNTTNLREASPSWLLDGRTIACRAAQRWPAARVLRARAQTVLKAYCNEDECTRQAARNLADFLNLQADHQADQGAAAALRAYYSRIAISEQLRLVADSREQLELESQKQHVLRERGVATGVDLTQFERRSVELDDVSSQLLSQDRQLQTRLSEVVELDYQVDQVRQEALEVQSSFVDVAGLQVYALETRADLAAWQLLTHQVNSTSVPVFAQMLTSVVGGWGLPLPPIVGLKKLLCPPDTSALVASFRQELCLALEAQRRWVSQDVAEKGEALNLAYERIAFAQRTVASWEQRLEQLERLESLGQSQPAESGVARSGLSLARTKEVERRLEARLAEVDLAEVVGGLCRRCCGGQPWLVTGF
ncbi:TolC family protein [Aureliella helgolandensis]|uniref:Outer membrane efflux protein n=1 Tax=Aureliella helgolandensis TaxID=2527968 RepID=A0A518GGC6_9BACT|nr:hypothetical protein [Aureliella helgolandensis]QDV27654.1 hypothetical protein Q31a_60470 [Aureliella helgolandensis]